MGIQLNSPNPQTGKSIQSANCEKWLIIEGDLWTVACFCVPYKLYSSPKAKATIFLHLISYILLGEQYLLIFLPIVSSIHLFAIEVSYY